MVVAGEGKGVGINEGPIDILRKGLGDSRDVGVVGTGASEDRRLPAAFAFALRSRTLRAANSIWMTMSFIPLLAVLYDWFGSFVFLPDPVLVFTPKLAFSSVNRSQTTFLISIRSCCVQQLRASWRKRIKSVHKIVKSWKSLWKDKRR